MVTNVRHIANIGMGVMKDVSMKQLVIIAILATVPVSMVVAENAEEIFRKTGIKGGLIVHLGCGNGELTASLKQNDRFFVQGLDTNKNKIEEARKQLLSKGLNGDVSLMHLTEDKLPYVDNLVNLLVVEEPGNISKEEMMRVVTPLGVLYIKEKGKWTRIVKPWPKEIDEWTHFLHDSQNNAVCHDELIGQPRSLRWVTAPRWARSHEEMASMSAMVSAQGKVFYIIDNAQLMSLRFPSTWKVIACDAFNGKKLWEKSVPTWVDKERTFRTGPVHLPRRLVAVKDGVFVTLGLDAPVSMLDASTGEILRVFEGTGWTEEIVCHRDALYLLIGSSENKRSGEGLHERKEPKMTDTRFLKAFDIETGKELWSRNAKGEDYILPLSLAVSEDKVFFQSIKGIVCLDAERGKQLWLTKRPTISRRYGWSTSTLVVAKDVVLCTDRSLNSKEGKKLGPAKTDLEWVVNSFTDELLSRKAKNILTAYSIKDGKELWSAPGGSGSYNSPVDLFVIDSEVWVGPRFTDAYDLKSGKVNRQFKENRDVVGMVHARCYRNKATSKYILTGRDGVEFIDTHKGWIGNNSWLRGTCQYGIMPANGLLYIPPDACACHPKTKLQGFNAVSSQLPESTTGKPIKADGRLLKGPAYGKTSGSAPSALDWPMYRSDPERSGLVKTDLSDNLKCTWTVELGGKLTQAVTAWGKVFVASTHAHTVYAIDAVTGKILWSHSAEGRVDSAPSLFRGLVIFGSADGYVYAVDHQSGKLAWRFCAAPEKRMISINGQLESSWPVHGSVLVHDDELVFTAGRSTYLDGGLYFYRLNPVTGEMLATSIISHIDPVTNKQTGFERKRSFDSEGTLSDIMSSDGKTIYVKHMGFDKNGKEVREKSPHLFTGTGFLGEEWFVRTFWIFGTQTGAGYFRWANMQSGNSEIAPAGRILSFNSKYVFGYGRTKHEGSWTGHRADDYHLFSSVKVYPITPKKEGPAGKRAKPVKAEKTFRWSRQYPLIVRSMVLANDKLIVAGVPDLRKKNAVCLLYDNPKESLEALEGKHGVYIWIVSAEDGKQMSQIKLDGVPVFDGMAVANNKVFVSLKNGKLVCFQ
jgi:outer membrane protein assembly factor BamB